MVSLCYCSSLVVDLLLLCSTERYIRFFVNESFARLTYVYRHRIHVPIVRIYFNSAELLLKFFFYFCISLIFLLQKKQEVLVAVAEKADHTV